MVLKTVGADIIDKPVADSQLKFECEFEKMFAMILNPVTSRHLGAR